MPYFLEVQRHQLGCGVTVCPLVSVLFSEKLVSLIFLLLVVMLETSHCNVGLVWLGVLIVIKLAISL